MRVVALSLGLVLSGCSGNTSAFSDVSGSLLILPNIDDDRGNGQSDWRRSDSSDDEVHQLVFPAGSLRAPGSHSFELVLSGDTREARVYSGEDIVLSRDTTTWSIEPTKDELVVGIEFKSAGAEIDLTLRHLKGGGNEVSAETLHVESARVLLDHHLQRAEHVWLMDMDEGWDYNNQHMVETYSEVLGDDVSFVSSREAGFDVWVQDEMQLAALTAPGQRHDYIIDSIRDGGLDVLPKSLEGENAPRETWGDGLASTYDSFGNLEVSPPIDGYPMGRIYYGTPDGVAEDLRDFLAAQAIQAPLELDSSWLCVGHVDEFMTFVPDPTAPQGFRMGYADIDLGYELFEAMDPALPLPRYARVDPFQGHARANPGEIVDDAGLRALNEDIRDNYLLPIRSQLMSEFGITEDEIIPMPVVFEEVPGCGGVAAMTPGMVNLVVVDFGNRPQIFLADPFVRNSDDPDQGQDDDPYIAWVRDNFPDTLDLHFVDDWFVYHMNLGEVHCGTNERRTPVDDWWVLAADLMESIP